MNTFPCKDCICLPICKGTAQKINEKYEYGPLARHHIIKDFYSKCTLIKDYLPVIIGSAIIKFDCKIISTDEAKYRLFKITLMFNLSRRGL